ncbi:MAG: redox-sensing transcriptional repressor Rex [Verrucomicrobia bacterium]|nr:redox-sensing transcriptional repressor Rex [Verrucomicrobiota bacterium]
MNRGATPRKTVYRLSLYYRVLQRLKANLVETVSSETLAKVSGVKPTQLRKDLAHLGHFGTRGLGYNVDALVAKLLQVMGTASLQPVILVGVGQLGSALLGYDGFEREGFEIVGAFDADPGRARSGSLKLPIQPMEALPAFVLERGIKIAILCAPGHVAQEIANGLVSSGIQAILNFAPTVLQVPERAVVSSVNLAAELENLSYFIR